jgi:hypothetical protein
MQIGPVELLVSQNGSNFDFTINYSLNFSQVEVDQNFEFEHQIVFWESDADEPFGGGDDDLFHVEREFTNPDSTVERFSFIVSATEDELDTEIDGEEIWAEVYARNSTTAGAVTSRKTPGFFYAGCFPPILVDRAFSTPHKPLWSTLLLLWTAVWLVLVASGSM